MKAVVAALIEKDGRFFLAKRSTSNKEAYQTGPKCHLDTFEKKWFLENSKINRGQ